MKRDDTIDPARWRQFLWRRDGALDDEAAAETPAPDANEADAEVAETPPRPSVEEAEATRSLFDDHAAWVDEVWHMPHGDERREAAKQLTAKLLQGFRCMQLNVRSPRAATRLLRLAVWIWPALAEDERAALRMGMAFAACDHPERAELLVESARLGDRHLAWLIGQHVSESKLHEEAPSLGRALVRVVEEARTWDARVVALGWLARGDWPEGLACFRDALRWPHLRCRCAALHAILARAGALRVDDVSWLLRDAVVHPIDRDRVSARDILYWYQDAVAEAVAARPPPDAHVPLERILRHDCARIGRDRQFLDDDWALRVLAAAAPERALTPIDRWMREPMSYRRRSAVEAAAALDEGHARPRLLTLAADADPEVARDARAAWTKRFATVCPVSPFAGIAMDILDGPPSPEFESRVTVLRNPDEGAREKMLRVVFDAPPTRETLGLILFGLRTFSGYHKQEGLPGSSEEILEALRARHGDLALDAVLLDLECSAVGSRWLHALHALARDGGLDEARRERTAHIATMLLLADPGDPDVTVLCVLGTVRPTDEAIACVKAMAVAEAVELEWALSDVFVARGPDAALDAWLVEAFSEARSAGAWARVVRFGTIALRRGVEALLAPIEHDLWNLDVPEARRALNRLAYAWRERGLADDRVLEALADPTKVGFLRVAPGLPEEDPARETAIGLLRAALNSDAFEGRSAAVALLALLRSGAMEPDDPKADAVQARAPIDVQDEILNVRTYQRNDDLTRFVPFVRALLVHPDEAVAVMGYETFDYKFKNVVPDDWLTSVLPEVRNEKVRAYLREDLGEPSEAELYWVDADDDS
jgi:hypothetical protein